MAKIISADRARNLLDAATPGPWEVNSDGEVWAGDECVIPGCVTYSADESLVLSAHDLAATVLDLHKRLAAERCEPGGAASERWSPVSRDAWRIKSSPWWSVRKAHNGEWVVHKNGTVVHSERYALDGMRWCDQQDGGAS